MLWDIITDFFCEVPNGLPGTEGQEYIGSICVSFHFPPLIHESDSFALCSSERSEQEEQPPTTPASSRGIQLLPAQLSLLEDFTRTNIPDKMVCWPVNRSQEAPKAWLGHQGIRCSSFSPPLSLAGKPSLYVFGTGWDILSRFTQMMEAHQIRKWNKHNLSLKSLPRESQHPWVLAGQGRESTNVPRRPWEALSRNLTGAFRRLQTHGAPWTAKQTAQRGLRRLWQRAWQRRGYWAMRFRDRGKALAPHQVHQWWREPSWTVHPEGTQDGEHRGPGPR